MTRGSRRGHPIPPNSASGSGGFVQVEDEVQRAVETSHARLLLAAVVFALVFLAIAARLVMVTLLPVEETRRVAFVQPPVTSRADIVDRNGVLLATSLSAAALYANPKQIRDPAKAATRLARAIPELNAAELQAKLALDKQFVWIKRNLTPRQKYAVNKLGIPGLYFLEAERRVYPHGALTGHVTGFTDVDNRGLAGVEQSFDDLLTRDSRPLQLSLDLRVQHILHEELSRAVSDFDGIGGTGLVLDVRTGEILALVSLPDFDPNEPAGASDEARFNRATLGIYEMGSTFKIFNTALALERGIVGLSDGYDASHPLRVSGYTITDYKPKNRWLSVPEIFIYSSNIGSAKMAVDIGTEAQQKFLTRLGMLRSASIELPEVGQPMTPHPWRPINTITIAYGHGMAVSPLHLAAGVAAIVNGGIMRPTTLIKRASDQISSGDRIVSEHTSEIMRQLLRLVVQAGTGKMADAPGYLVGGKTGTADKLHGRTYAQNARMASFVAAFPINAPRFVVLVMVDEPKPNKSSHGYATGGWVAAPAVGRIVQRMAPLVGIAPVPEEAPEARNELLIAVSATGQVRASE